jgi:molybdopterin-guanine dinucleotide biosynthesis protein A
MNLCKPAGVILAGGRSRRMGDGHKALYDFHGRPLLARVIDRIKPHLDPLLLSCESGNSEFNHFGLPLVPDLLPNFRGPLTGLYSALQAMADLGQDTGLVLCPCDAPFVPSNLVRKLVDAYKGGNKPVVVVSYRGVLQPTFSLWQIHHLPVIRDAVLNKGVGGLKQVLLELPHTVLEWAPAEPPPFFNINTPAELKTALQWLDHKDS